MCSIAHSSSTAEPCLTHCGLLCPCIFYNRQHHFQRPHQSSTLQCNRFSTLPSSGFAMFHLGCHETHWHVFDYDQPLFCCIRTSSCPHEWEAASFSTRAHSACWVSESCSRVSIRSTTSSSVGAADPQRDIPRLANCSHIDLAPVFDGPPISGLLLSQAMLFKLFACCKASRFERVVSNAICGLLPPVLGRMPRYSVPRSCLQLSVTF